MKHFTLTICSAAVLLFSCNDNKSSSSTTDVKTDTTKMADTMAANQPAATPAPAHMPDSATMMKNWQAYATPGDVHKMMASWNGTWDADITMWEKPGAAPQMSKGTAVNRMDMGGRYQISNHKSTMMGMPFEGMSILAYDNAKKMFKSSWIDNMGTGLMMMDGTWDDASKTLSLKGKCTNACMGDGSDAEMREVMKVVDDKTQTMEMYGPGPDGKEYKVMDIKFTKKA